MCGPTYEDDIFGRSNNESLFTVFQATWLVKHLPISGQTNCRENASSFGEAAFGMALEDPVELLDERAGTLTAQARRAPAAKRFVQISRVRLLSGR
jgi:hypothetical protein